MTSSVNVVKILICGEQKSGKSSLLKSINENDFDDAYLPTTMSDLTLKEVLIDDNPVALQIWDVGDSTGIGRSFLRGTQAVIFVVDMTLRNSLDRLDFMYESIVERAGFKDELFTCAIFGNKIDLIESDPSSDISNNQNEDYLTLQDLQKWAQNRRHNKNNDDYYPIDVHLLTAKKGDVVLQRFLDITRLALSRKPPQSYKTSGLSHPELNNPLLINNSTDIDSSDATLTSAVEDSLIKEEENDDDPSAAKSSSNKKIAKVIRTTYRDKEKNKASTILDSRLLMHSKNINNMISDAFAPYSSSTSSVSSLNNSNKHLISSQTINNSSSTMNPIDISAAASANSTSTNRNSEGSGVPTSSDGDLSHRSSASVDTVFNTIEELTNDILTAKIIIAGAPAVGKTLLLSKYLQITAAAAADSSKKESASSGVTISGENVLSPEQQKQEQQQTNRLSTSSVASNASRNSDFDYGSSLNVLTMLKDDITDRKLTEFLNLNSSSPSLSPTTGSTTIVPNNNENYDVNGSNNSSIMSNYTKSTTDFALNGNTNNNSYSTIEEDAVATLYDDTNDETHTMQQTSTTTRVNTSDENGEDENVIIEYEPTLFANFRETELEINQQKVSLQIWDFGGDLKMQILGKSTYKYSDCLILVFDLTNRDSFDHLDIYWNNYIQYTVGDETEEFPVVLVGNKCDCQEIKRKVTYEEILEWCAEKRPDNPVIYMECSALKNINVKDIFHQASQLIYDFCVVEDDDDNNNDGDDDFTINEDDEEGEENDEDDEEELIALQSIIPSNQDERSVYSEGGTTDIHTQPADWSSNTDLYKRTSSTKDVNNRNARDSFQPYQRCDSPELEKSCWFGTALCFAV